MTEKLRNGGKSETVDIMTKQPGQINLSFSHAQTHKNDSRGNHTDQVALRLLQDEEKVETRIQSKFWWFEMQTSNVKDLRELRN